MDPSCPPAELHRRGLALADAGRCDDALACLREHLLVAPKDARALNDAGVILYRLGRFDEAARHLACAARAGPGGCAQVLANLAEAYLAAGRAREAAAMLAELARNGALTADLASRMAAALAAGSSPAEAVDLLLLCRDLLGESPALAAAAAAVRSGRPKVALICDPTCPVDLGPHQAFLAERFDSRMYRGRDAKEVARLLRWADIAWFEQCLPLVVAATQMPKASSFVCRLGDGEAGSAAMEQVVWANVDALAVSGNPAQRQLVLERLAGLTEPARLVTIPPGVYPERFSLSAAGRGKDLACATELSLRTCPILLLECFRKLHELDGGFRLHFAGCFRDEALERYMRHMVGELGLADCVRFAGWQDDAAAWLGDKHYVLAGGVDGGIPRSVLEGMARGLKPVVHAFPGAADVFPADCLFRTVDEFCDRVLAGRYEPRRYREFVAERFSLDGQLERMNRLLIELEAELAPAAPGARGGVGCTAGGGGPDGGEGRDDVGG